MDERYIFPVYAIEVPLTEIIEHRGGIAGDWNEEVEIGKHYQVWDQTCNAVCTCSEKETAEYIAGMMNHLNDVRKSV
jgi:hypothetical protein